ncbi:MAG: lipoyl synthase, partial [Methylococcales bacterium]|nr:lipoyl synthase [Methylococcales bacterium]
MTTKAPFQAPSRSTPDSHQRNDNKLSRIPIKVDKTIETLRKPDWIRVKIPVGNKVNQIKKVLREKKLHSVCEEAACPNLAECFQHGTATFMIMGDLCTRRCPFCDVAHG